MDHEVFFKKQVALLNHPDNTHRRRFLYKELDAWYTDFKPTKKRKGRSVGRTSMAVPVTLIPTRSSLAATWTISTRTPERMTHRRQASGRPSAPWPPQRPVPPREAAVEN